MIGIGVAGSHVDKFGGCLQFFSSYELVCSSRKKVGL